MCFKLIVDFANLLTSTVLQAINDDNVQEQEPTTPPSIGSTVEKQGEKPYKGIQSQ